MQILIGGVLYEITAEGLFLLGCGIMTLYALISAGLAWLAGDPGCFDPNSGSSENEDLPLCTPNPD